jgi:hypothetical protein
MSPLVQSCRILVGWLKQRCCTDIGFVYYVVSRDISLIPDLLTPKRNIVSPIPNIEIYAGRLRDMNWKFPGFMVLSRSY